jgi:hypothetical protein
MPLLSSTSNKTPQNLLPALPLPLKHPPIILQTPNLLLQATLERSSNLLFHSLHIPLRIRLAVEIDNLILLLYPHAQVSVCFSPHRVDSEEETKVQDASK